MREYVVAITGASGSLCGRRLLAELAGHPDVSRVNVVASRGARKVAQAELGLSEPSQDAFSRLLSPSGSDKVQWYGEDEIEAPISSGSYPCDGMAVVPCSTGTLASIAHGVSRNLVHRAAEVSLKERRRLILGIRESPYNLIQIENMRLVTLAGAIVAPITPLFYNRPVSLDEIVEQYTARVLDLMGLEHDIGKRWKSDR